MISPQLRGIGDAIMGVCLVVVLVVVVGGGEWIRGC